MPTENYSEEEYRNDFREAKKKEAFQLTLDIRKFEIDLYWKRAAYFWTFIAATLAGFGAVQASESPNKTDLSVLLACLGVVFSFGWFFVNRGSKHWQENWENHLDMLEDDFAGPLYKVILTRSKPKKLKEWLHHAVTGPSPISVSKINQIISLYVAILWVVLLCYSLNPLSVSAPVNFFHLGLVALTLVTCIGFYVLGKTYQGGYKHYATKRTAHIDNEN